MAGQAVAPDRPVSFDPKVGDLVVYRCSSAISGRLVNLRLEEVTKVTQAGFIHIKGNKFDKYRRGAPDAFYEHRPRYLGLSNYRIVLTKPTPEELDTLPRDPVGGRKLADVIQSKLNTQRKHFVR